mgnify:FL=1
MPVRYQGTGKFQGRIVETIWEDGEFDCSDLEAGYAIIDESIEWLDRILVLASGERVRGDLLEHPAGFACIAGLVLEDFTSDYVPDDPVPEGAYT